MKKLEMSHKNVLQTCKKNESKVISGTFRQNTYDRLWETSFWCFEQFSKKITHGRFL